MAQVRRRALLTAGATVAVAGVGLAAAFAPLRESFPWIIDCDSWGAAPPTLPLVLHKGTTNKIILQQHQYVKGFPDTGHHFTISRGGYVLEGRRGSLETLETGAAQLQAAHCPGRNNDSIGIENDGTYTTQSPPGALQDSLVRLCVAICERYSIKAHNIFGHWDFRETQCPGAAFYRWFPELRREVANKLGTRLWAIPRRTWPDIYSSIGGRVVRVAQHLLRHRGYPMEVTGVWSPAMTAAVQDWQAKHGLPADPTGTFTSDTWETLVPQLDPGSTGEPVSAIQAIVPDKGYANVTITGVFDDPTRAAVHDVQRLHGLSPNGKVDTSTWCALVGGIVREAF